jgi:hypothetical protein
VVLLNKLFAAENSTSPSQFSRSALE